MIFFNTLCNNFVFLCESDPTYKVYWYPTLNVVVPYLLTHSILHGYFMHGKLHVWAMFYSISNNAMGTCMVGRLGYEPRSLLSWAIDIKKIHILWYSFSISYDPHNILHTRTTKTRASKRVNCQAYKKLDSYGLGGATGDPGGCPGHSSMLCLFLSTLTVTRWWTVFRLLALRWCRAGILWHLRLAKWHSLARRQSFPTLSIVRLRMCLRNRDELANYKRFSKDVFTPLLWVHRSI